MKSASYYILVYIIYYAVIIGMITTAVIGNYVITGMLGLFGFVFLLIDIKVYNPLFAKPNSTSSVPPRISRGLQTTLLIAWFIAVFSIYLNVAFGAFLSMLQRDWVWAGVLITLASLVHFIDGKFWIDRKFWIRDGT